MKNFQNQKIRKIGIFGNLALDNYPKDIYGVNRTKKILIQKGINFNGSPKITFENIEELLHEIRKKEKLDSEIGGGGYNSLNAFLYLADHDFTFLYYDLSKKPYDEYTSIGFIKDSRIDYRFQGLSGICTSLILEELVKRKIVKTKRLDRDIKLTNSNLEKITKILQECDAIFVNSIANYQVAETIGKTTKPKYVVVTKNLSKERLEKSDLIKNSTAIIDIEESDIIGGHRGKNPKNIVNILSRLHCYGVENSVVTMDKDGVAFLDKYKFKLIKTNENKEKEIQKYIKKNNIHKTQTGDYFAASLAYFLEKGENLENSIINSQLFVIKNKLKFPCINQKDFEFKNLEYT